MIVRIEWMSLRVRDQCLWWLRTWIEQGRAAFELLACFEMIVGHGARSRGNIQGEIREHQHSTCKHFKVK